MNWLTWVFRMFQTRWSMVFFQLNVKSRRRFLLAVSNSLGRDEDYDIRDSRPDEVGLNFFSSLSRAY